jgi:hypothetical protein
VGKNICEKSKYDSLVEICSKRFEGIPIVFDNIETITIKH